MDRRNFMKISTGAAVALWIETVVPRIKTYAGNWEKQPIPEMIYREYGTTGKKVSLLGFGGMRFDTGPIKEGNLDLAAQLVVDAYNLGVNYFDSAPTYYADGRSEEIFGLAFKEIERMNQGKNDPLPYYWTTKSAFWQDGDAKAVRKRLDTSLKRFGKDKIPFYHMWCFRDMEQYKEVMAPGGPYEGALEAKKEGLIDHIVFSSHLKGEDTAKVVNDGAFDGVLVGYNITNFPRQQEALKAIKEKNIGLAVMNPLAGGLIPEHEEYFQRLMGDSKTDITVVQTALAFLMGHSEISVVLSGITTKEHLIENVKSLNFYKLFEDEELAALKKQYLNKIEDICTTCEYCDVCPVDIPVYRIMRAYNELILNGKESFIEHVANLKNGRQKFDLKAEVAKCIRCGACERACTQHLKIIQRFDEITNDF